MKKIIIAAFISIAFFSFIIEKEASIQTTELEYNTIQRMLYDIAISSDSLDGSHQTIKRIQNNAIALQNFFKERVGNQFDTTTKKADSSAIKK